jgi:ribosomal protein S18 acetylase RimI-like enzyme
VGTDIHDITIRSYRPEDLTILKQLTVSAFDGVTLEQNVEERLGIVGGHDWRWRKERHIDEDVAANPAGVFVAEIQGRVVGYITTQLDRDAGKGRIPNMAVSADLRGLGLGRRLIEEALRYFRQEGLHYCVIETMAHNEIGNHLYPSCGFIEVARQVHFARTL